MLKNKNKKRLDKIKTSFLSKLKFICIIKHEEKGSEKVQEKKSIKTYEELPDTITPYDYAEWRGIGENKAREIFNSKGFPRLKGTGVKQLADKVAVRLYDMGLNEEDRKEVLKETAKLMLV